jgi:hypothetical protein
LMIEGSRRPKGNNIPDGSGSATLVISLSYLIMRDLSNDGCLDHK